MTNNHNHNNVHKIDYHLNISTRKRNEGWGEEFQKNHGMEGQPHGHTLLQRLLQPNSRSDVSELFKYGYYWSNLHSAVLIRSPANSMWFTRACWVIYFSVSIIIIIIIIIIDRFYVALYILRSRADSLRSHVILHQWIAFYSAFLNIHRSGVLTALAWLVTHETAAVSARSVYAIQPCTMSLHAKPHT